MNKVLIFIFSLWLLTGCSSKHSINESQITVSILPQKYFIEQIAGNIFNINVMIPPGASPATYEPLPKQIEEISRSKAYFSIGHLIFEETWLPKFKSNNPELKIFDLSDNIKIIENHYHHDGHHHTIDPHIWVSPRKVRIITSNIKDYLIKLYPENKPIFENNYLKFLQKTDSIDQLLMDISNQSKNKSFLIYHPALTHLADDYNFEQISIEFEGKSPSAEYLMKLIKTANKKNIKHIFVQKEFNKENAVAIAKEIHAEILEINPLGYNWEENMLDIIEKFRLITENE